jgi:hypothetical protein
MAYRQINEDRWPSCTPLVWDRPEDERGGRESDKGLICFVGRFRNTQSSRVGARFGVGTHGSIKSEAGRNPLPPEVALAFPVDDRFGSIATEIGYLRHVRFIPDSGSTADVAALRTRADCGLG